MRLRKLLTGCAALATVAAVTFAEDTVRVKEADAYFKLEFVVKEVDGGKVLNARTYSAIASNNSPKCVIRAGSKVPVPVSNEGAISQFSYVDVGVNIDCLQVRKSETGNDLSLRIVAEVSSLPPDATAHANPVIRQNRWESAVVVVLEKPTVVFSSDDVSTKHQIQLELTAKQLK